MEFRQRGSTPLEWKTADTYLLSGLGGLLLENGLV